MPQNKTNRANDTSIKSMYVNVHVFIREYIPIERLVMEPITASWK